MIATLSTAQLSRTALYGCSILGCCCKDEVEPGGSSFPAEPARPDRTPIDNPFVTFTPPVATVTQSPPAPSIQGVIGSRPYRDAGRGTLGASGASERRRQRVLPVRQSYPAATDAALRDAFQMYLKREEDEFLALLLASEDEDCCYDFC